MGPMVALKLSWLVTMLGVAVASGACGSDSGTASDKETWRREAAQAVFELQDLHSEAVDAGAEFRIARLIDCEADFAVDSKCSQRLPERAAAVESKAAFERTARANMSHLIGTAPSKEAERLAKAAEAAYARLGTTLFDPLDPEGHYTGASEDAGDAVRALLQWGQ